MIAVLMRQLLEAGVHFGHQTRKWNPKMKEYIFGERNGIYIINLRKTVDQINEACAFVKDIAASGKTVLFVGTKKQAQETIRTEAKRCACPYVEERWLGGMLTNHETIRKSVHKLEGILQMEEDGSLQLRTKKEMITLRKQKEKLEKYLSGVKDMVKIPGAVFIVDPKHESIAVKEAIKLGIPVVAIVDTNCDPDEVDYCIPANDDAIKSIQLITSRIVDAIGEGQASMLVGTEEEPVVPVGEEEQLSEVAKADEPHQVADETDTPKEEVPLVALQEEEGTTDTVPASGDDSSEMSEETKPEK